MAGEGIQNYVDMAAGLTKATRAKARAAARSLLATAGLEDATDRAGRLADEVIAASRANRELMGKLVAAEVDKAASRLGFVRNEELEELRRELADLRMSMAHASAGEAAPFADGFGIPDPPATVDALVEPDEPPTIDLIDEPVVPPTAVKRSAAKKTAAKKTAASGSARKRGAAKTAEQQTPTRKAPRRKTPAKKSPAEGIPANDEAATNTPAETTDGGDDA